MKTSHLIVFLLVVTVLTAPAKAHAVTPQEMCTVMFLAVMDGYWDRYEMEDADLSLKAKFREVIPSGEPNLRELALWNTYAEYYRKGYALAPTKYGRGLKPKSQEAFELYGGQIKEAGCGGYTDWIIKQATRHYLD